MKPAFFYLVGRMAKTMASLRAFSPPEEGTPYMKGVGMLVVSLSAVISDFGLA